MGKFKDMDMNMKDECCGGHHCGQDAVGAINFGPPMVKDGVSLTADVHPGTVTVMEIEINKPGFLDRLSKEIFENNKAKGFWDDAILDVCGVTDFVPEFRNTGELIALMHSELSEALEAHRKDKMDDHLPQYKGVQVELADALIRILDYCGAHDVAIGEIVRAKVEYNKTRPHKHGKKF